MTTSRRLPWFSFLLLAALPPGAGVAEPAPSTPEPPTVTSVPVDACPKMDGSAEDAAWRWAPETEVRMTEPTAAGMNPRGWIRSVHDAEWVWFLVTWEDGTRDVEHRPWIWNAKEGAYEEGKQREDMLRLSFEHVGPFSADPLASDEATFDEWDWKAARTDPVGHAMDRFERRTRTKPEGEAHEVKGRDGTTAWVVRSEDAGDPIQKKRDAPVTNEGERVPRYVANKPTGSAADVTAKGAWKGGRWTVELGRALSTGCPDDAVFDLAQGLRFAVGTPRGNSEADGGSGVLRLRFGRTMVLRSFDHQEVGNAAGLRPGLTGGGGPVSWVIEADPDRSPGHVLAQRSQDPTDYRFPIAVLEGIRLKDVDLSVRFKTLSGEVDQAAGLIWRHRDAGNYYVVRANALEGNVVLYRVKDGKREDLPLRGLGQTYGVEAPVPQGAWGTLRVVCVGRTMEVYLDGRKLFDVDDHTFTEAGGVGVWTKADSVTLFDDLVAVSFD